jgi:3-mercaptopyruvate sulfurtransferase SseA
MKILLASLLALAAATAVQAEKSSEKSPLVTTEWLSKNLENPKVRIVEVSVEPGVYEQGHIPGAANVKWHTDLVDNPRRDIVSKEQFEALASKLGLTPETEVLLYGDNNNWFAAWGAWIFKLYGHDNVKLVDGGRKKWELEKRPLDTTAPSISATKYMVKEVNSNLRARCRCLQRRGKGGATLVDIRSPDEYWERSPRLRELGTRDTGRARPSIIRKTSVNDVDTRLRVSRSGENLWEKGRFSLRSSIAAWRALRTAGCSERTFGLRCRNMTVLDR